MEIKKVLAGALVTLIENRNRLAVAVLWPSLVLILLDVILFFEVSLLTSYAIQAITFVAYVFFAVAIHRFVLLGPGSISKWGITKWSMRETTFLVFLVMFLLIIPIPLFLGFIHFAGIIVGALLAIWLAARLSLIFPAIAVDKRISFSDSWAYTKHYQELMISVVVLLPFMLGLVGYLFNYIPYGYFLFIPLSLLFIVYEVAALSLSYHLIISNVDRGQASYFTE